MRLPRLSYQAAGAAFAPRAEPQPRAAAPPLGPAVTAPTPAPHYGGAATHRRQRRIAVAALVALHAIAVVGLLQASRLRQVVIDAKPLFLALVDAPAPVVSPNPLPPPPSFKITPPPPLTVPMIATETATAAAPLVAEELPAPSPAAPATAVQAPAAPAPSPPRTIPPSAVQYLVPPVPVYSRVSVRMRESGKALVRVFIDEAGLPRDVQLATSTGFARLDDAALAAVRHCRFRPYLDNGVAVAGWAAVPIEFELPT